MPIPATAYTTAAWLSNDRFSLLMRTFTAVPAGKGLIVSA
jgi:hypothetical protein